MKTIFGPATCQCAPEGDLMLFVVNKCILNDQLRYSEQGGAFKNHKDFL